MNAARKTAPLIPKPELLTLKPIVGSKTRRSICAVIGIPADEFSRADLIQRLQAVDHAHAGHRERRGHGETIPNTTATSAATPMMRGVTSKETKMPAVILLMLP